MRSARIPSLLAVTAAGALALSACSGGSGGEDAEASGGSEDRPKVVTTTNVYADVVEQVAGEDVEVTPIISSTSQDPHSYEATAQDRLTVEDADLVVLNGGGYDEFMEDMAEDSGATVIDAVELSGLQPEEHEHSEEEHAEDEEGHEHHHDHGEFNEHVWYNLDVMGKVTDQVASDLGDLDSDGADQYRQNAEDYSGQLDELKDQAAGIEGEGKSYLATEPVPGYLLDSTGMEDATPEDFVAAIEDGNDVPAATLQDVLDQLSSGQVDLLAFNEQTESGQTRQVMDAAESDGVASVSFTETIPDGQDYLGWMKENIEHVADAV
ncbi:metal ABC transporter solute-binding protein, Zn/Mn family [Rothia halotolerans]|uniref:metal ABC transporter solute-binding protein, Zn/Mn family n=1 Tax=Rothia halotolerans TaxID=405770 RepID=UPI00101C45DD|nr:zinc ABC transporter substrate-binding protein [Rothia halotolerans]